MGHAYSTTAIELVSNHPIFWCDGTALRLWTGVRPFSGDYNDLANKPDVQQSDWSQNDSEESDYIKNRTHWAETGYTNTCNVLNSGLTVETGTQRGVTMFDFYGSDPTVIFGNIDDSETVDYEFVINGTTYTVSIDNTYTYLVDGSDSTIIEIREGVTDPAHLSNDMYYIEGRWYSDVSDMSLYLELPTSVVSQITSFEIKRIGEVVHKLDDKYINNSNWDSDANEPGYVENRTHYRYYGNVLKNIKSSCQVNGNNNVVWVYCEGSALDFFFDDQKADGTYKKFGWIVNGTEFGMFSPVNQHEYNFSSGDSTICDVYIGNEPTSSLTSGMYYIQRSYDSENDIMRLTGYFLSSTGRAVVDWSSWLTSSVVVWEDWVYETLDNRYLNVALNDLSNVEIGDPIDYENTYFPDALINEGRHYDAIVLNNRVWLTSNFLPNYFQDGTPIPMRNIASATDPYRWSQMYNIAAVLSKNFFPDGWGIKDEYTKLNSSTPKAYASINGWTTSSVTGSPGCNPDENNSSGLGLTPETGSGRNGTYLNIPSGSSAIYAYALSYDQTTISYTQKTIGTDTDFYSIRLAYNGSVREFINHYYKEKLRDGDTLRYDATKQKWVNSSDYNNIQEITYDELVSLRNHAQLVKGKQYKIIDYETLINGDLVNIGTVSHNTSIGSNDYEYARAINSYPFDIIVTATSGSTLDEHARTSAKPGDEFADYINDLELKYCLDNNKYYAWSLDYYDASITYDDVEDPDNPITKTATIRFYKTNRKHTVGTQVYPVYIGILEGTLQTFYQAKSTIESGDVLTIQRGD